MTRFRYSTAASLDGYIADPDHSLSWLFEVPQAESDPGRTDPWSQFIAEVGVVVLGSSTYEWLLRETGALERPDQWPAAVDGRPAVVFTHRELPRPDGADLTFASGEVTGHLASLRDRAGGRDVFLMGGGDLVGQFAAAGALDEITVSIAPVTLGAGAPLLPHRLTSRRLTLTSVEQRGQLAQLVYAVSPG